MYKPKNIVLNPDVIIQHQGEHILLSWLNECFLVDGIFISSDSTNGDSNDLSVDSFNSLLNTCNFPVEELYIHGFLYDQQSPSTWENCTGYNLVYLLISEIRNLESQLLANLKSLNDLISGKYTDRQIRGWLLENYHYTRSAEYHITPTLSNSSSYRKHEWNNFLEEERYHWKIYKNVFDYIDMSFDEVNQIKPIKETSAFIESLRYLSRNNLKAYSAVLCYIEQSPDAESLSDDPLFSSLVTYYGFPMKSISPLWEHAKANETLRHNSIGIYELCDQYFYSANELSDIRNGLKMVIQNIANWHTGIYEAYSHYE